jgi:predicted RNA binding protein YcfA (HicA-like mRNA interferase family)
VKVKEVLKRLSDEGWYLDRQVGSHRQYKHSTISGTVTVAGKESKDIPRGTWNSIQKQAGWKVLSEHINDEDSSEDEEENEGGK